MSLSVGYTLGKTFVPDFETWSVEDQEAFAERIDQPVRKCAHAAEYAILGLLLAGTVISNGVGRNRSFKQKIQGEKLSIVAQYAICFIIGAAYAASDEFHQLFVPGRAGRVTDVLIDSGGVIFGLFIAFIVSWMKNLKFKR